MIVVKVAISLDCSSASSTPVLDLVVGAELGLDLLRQLIRAGALGRRRLDRVELAFLAGAASAPSAGRRSRTSSRRSSWRSPYFAIPTISNSCAGPSAATPIRSPSCRSWSSATPSSTATSSPPRGQRPSTRLSGLAVEFGSRLDPEGERGRAARVDRLAVGRSSFVWKSCTELVATSTRRRCGPARASAPGSAAPRPTRPRS